MHHPRQLTTSAYSYPLPDDRIARFPLADRDQSKLVIYKQGVIEEDIYQNISRYVAAGSLLVFNNTKVIRARLLFRKPTGGMIEIFLLEPENKEAYASFQETVRGAIRWKCLVGGAGKWKRGQVMEKEMQTGTGPVILQARIADRQPDCFVIGFSWQPAHLSFSEILEEAGTVPIPPYLKRDAATGDTERYQTIYATQQGSVAAPTAGLHFTDAVFGSLASKGVGVSFITLHVGAGTFTPMKSETLEGHTMHAEWMIVELEFIQQLLVHTGQVIAVGTTSMRTLESLYWMGLKCLANPSVTADQLAVGQWEPYDKEDTRIDADQSLRALQAWIQKEGSQHLMIETRLLIAPPYQPRLTDGLVTNFHQPGSTLLLLVAAVTGGRWKYIYDYALEHAFRFLSYGDGCLIFFR